MEKNSREIEKTPRKRKSFTIFLKNLKNFAEKLKDFVGKPMKFEGKTQAISKILKIR